MNKNHLERYLSGEFTTVWLEIGVLREAELGKAALEDVQAVVLETMRRIQFNLELITQRLDSMGFEFGSYDSPKFTKARPIKPHKDSSKTLDHLSSIVGGPTPLTFRVFFELIGEVDFRGSHPQFQSQNLPDALMIDLYLPEAEEVANWLENSAGDLDFESARYEQSFAPDAYHKELMLRT
jgi:hypothetical protein